MALGRGHIEMMETPVASVVSKEFPRIGPESTAGEAIDSLVLQARPKPTSPMTAVCSVGNCRSRLIQIRAADSFADMSALSIKHDASLQQAIEAARFCR